MRWRQFPLTLLLILCCAHALAAVGTLQAFEGDIRVVAAGSERAAQNGMTAALLAIARRQGASAGYLQVAAENVAAKRLYAGLGFVQAYEYHYRSDDPRTWD